MPKWCTIWPPLGLLKKKKAMWALYQETTVAVQDGLTAKNSSVTVLFAKSQKTAATRKREQLEQKIKVFYTNSELARSLPHKRYTTKHGPAFVMIVTIKGAHRMFVNRYPQLDLLAEMKLDLKQPARGSSFAEHLFTAYWQQNQYKYAINTLMPVMSVPDNKKAKTLLQKAASCQACVFKELFLDQNMEKGKPMENSVC
ncbi:hypothetical protein PoB_005634900 [Plakobranchus ocellatus]|uniref:Uncharacterized protein n=1 Tax=Plakobranchus ocellatus TaxID=259542 RepID=A0AAV4CFB0_9GAST|nr:hypothetical protein PoB_005634900 [Plakobranchus ocellatus]